MLLASGQRVRCLSSGEVGHVLRGPSMAGYYEIQFADCAETVPGSDLEGLAEADPSPLALLEQGRFGIAEEHDLFVRAAVLDHAFQYDDRSGLSNSRIEPKLHQVFVMNRVLAKSQARMILADEVGLGKTIEAGLLIKELRARKLADRVLIVTPASLLEQWRHELKSKFNEDFEVIDGAALKHLGRGKRNAWDDLDSIICSLPFAVGHEEDIRTSTPWDLVIFDEAHKVSRRLQSGSWEAKKSFLFADAMTEATAGLLLLTATPLQVHTSQLYSLVNLVEPGLFGTEKQFERQRRDLPALNELMKAVQGCVSRSEHGRRTRIEPHAHELLRFGLSVEEVVRRTAEGRDREALLNELAGKHPLADVIVRNRKREVLDGFQPRIPKTHSVQATALETELYREITEYIRTTYDTAIRSKNRAVGFLMVTFQKMLTSSSAALIASFEKRVARLNQWLQADVPVAASARRPSQDEIDQWYEATELSLLVDELSPGATAAEAPHTGSFRAAVSAEILELEGFIDRLRVVEDSKGRVLLEALESLFDRDPAEKVLIFTQFIETQRYLVELLTEHDISAEVFNGGLSLDEKERAVQRFRERSQALVSTEAGGEGRNFQFCHVMVNYDLPWNPMRVEQRIGRIDRIGQTRPVEIHNLAIEGTLESRVLEVLQSRIRMFEESVGSLDPILGDIEREFEHLAMTGAVDVPETFQAFERSVDQRIQDAVTLEDAEADLATDRNSFRRDEANRWLQRVPMAGWTHVRDFAAESLEYFGGRMSRSEDGHTVIALSPALKADLRAKRARYQGEFDPALAMYDDTDEFFAMGHEVVTGLVELAGERDARICGAFTEPGLDAPIVEILYQMRSPAGRPRGELIRHRVGRSLVVHSEIVDAFPEKRAPMRRPCAPDWVASALRASTDYLEAVDLARFGAESAVALEVFKKNERSRLSRIHQHASERLAAERARLEALIRELEEHGTESQKRILPARRGALKKAEARIEEELVEHDRQMAELEALKPGHRSRVIAATLVMPE